MTTTATPIQLTPESDLSAFRAFFAAIPEEKWGTFTRCAMQHLYEAVGGDAMSMTIGPVARRLNDLFAPLGGDAAIRYPGSDMRVVRVNDGVDLRYQQSSPRARILAAIDDLIAGTVPPIPEKA